MAAAGCSGESGPEPREEETTTGVAEIDEAPVPEAVEPLDLDIISPTGYVALPDEVREVPVAEQFNDYVFALDGGHETSKIIISSYVLDQEVDAGDYRAAVDYIRAYHERTGYEFATSNDRRSIVHGRQGVVMFAEYTDAEGNPATQQNHYLFKGGHLVVITCQWHEDFAVSFEACKQVTQDFPFPEWWT